MNDLGTAYMDWLETTTIGAYERACAQLTELHVDDVERALRLTALLVEALEGFAYGCVMGHISLVIARWFGDAKGRAVKQRLRRFIALRRDVHADDGATLREHLQRQLCARVAHLPVRPMVHDTLDYISQPHVLAIAFDAARRDTLHVERLTYEVAIGWQHLRACLERAPVPTVSPLWAEWQRRALRLPPAPDVASHDYILRIG
jgi:hypothetical protein